jgi:hypothetical protein
MMPKFYFHFWVYKHIWPNIPMDDHRHFGYITIYVIKKETMSIYYAIQTYLFPSLISSFLSHQHGHEKAHF